MAKKRQKVRQGYRRASAKILLKPQRIVSSKEEVAKAFDIHTNTVLSWLRRGMPRRTDGKFDLTAIQRWVSLQKDMPSYDYQSNHAQEYRKFKAKMAELDYKKAIGELLPKDEVEAGRVARIMTVKRALLALPTSLAPTLVGLDVREIQVRLTERVREIIRAFAGQAPAGRTP